MPRILYAFDRERKKNLPNTFINVVMINVAFKRKHLKALQLRINKHTTDVCSKVTRTNRNNESKVKTAHYKKSDK